MIRLKRVYEKPAPGDGMRILVERLWPRGLKKEDARVDRWMKEIAPRTELRQWFGHDPERWPEFQRRYRAELKAHQEQLQELRALARRATVTLVYAARDEEHNSAVVLKRVLAANTRRMS
ncbi:MAG: hypothetical protein B7Z66_06290 [Chromatiales bacterium 21-64-14]|nr:MAG: hypothetical protein B7Z66_06290 [Chromatiales bacterium 21-64-14]HQU15878.1 DUF488 domain-containing protein [Gammaproteobacteria bacterium]